MNRRKFLSAIGVGLAALSLPIPAFRRYFTDEDKIVLVRRLLENAIAAHDDLIERALFASGSSMAEHLVYTQQVGGSTPSPTTTGS